MGKQKLSAIYHKLDIVSSSKNPVNLEEGIFVRKANYENPLSPEKRDSILKKSQEKKKPRTRELGLTQKSKSWVIVHLGKIK
ncbi:hypothetical protein HanIR_Chr12g0605311 [Helianthus annuus]|nr:hypothetical protein HanIR_Chr12g0605311 [Helianthus annuus]